MMISTACRTSHCYHHHYFKLNFYAANNVSESAGEGSPPGRPSEALSVPGTGTQTHFNGVPHQPLQSSSSFQVEYLCRK
jgi:hypothetical protein